MPTGRQIEYLKVKFNKSLKGSASHLLLMIHCAWNQKSEISPNYKVSTFTSFLSVASGVLKNLYNIINEVLTNKRNKRNLIEESALKLRTDATQSGSSRTLLNSKTFYSLLIHFMQPVEGSQQHKYNKG